MRLKIRYSPEKGRLLLPVHYNYLLQSFLYYTFSQKIAEFLHNKGFLINKRQFRLFTFSRILEKGERVVGEELSELKSQLNINERFTFKTKRNTNTEEALYFKNGISFFFSSPKDFIIEDIGNRVIMLSEFNLLNQKLFINSIEVLPPPVFSDKVNIKMLSPVTVYSTLENSNRKLTYYYSPYEKEFSELIQKNAEKKYTLIHEKEPTEKYLKITPLHFSEKRNRAVVYFKNTRIEGWTGIFTLEGSPEMIKTVYEAGIGSKNPEGFGMWEVYKEGKRTHQKNKTTKSLKILRRR